ncbi:MAG: diacylglycerol kinase family protein [Candidatus Hydrogenedentota bacterium]
MKVRIIANPIAGGGRGKRLAEALRDTLNGNVDAVELVLTKQAGDNEIEAARPGADCVVAVGGDGSVNEVVNGLVDSDALLAILPAGTANVVARELDIPSDPNVVAKYIIAGNHRIMDAGLHGGRRFLLGGGAGLDAAIVHQVSQQRGKKSGLSKWVMPSIRTCLRYTFPQFRVVGDGRILAEDAQYVIVGNCRYSAGVFPATPKAQIDDGLLDVCVLRNLSPLRLLGLLPSVRVGRHIDRDDVLYRQCEHVELIPADEQDIPLQIDGDPRELLPATFSVEPGAIRVITG